jgi:hypothetical protein
MIIPVSADGVPRIFFRVVLGAVVMFFGHVNSFL